MGRPSLALCLIVKNEVKNLPVLMASVKDCFDEIHITDTGSEDGTIELITQWHHKNANPANTDIYLHGFKWVNDFSAARNYSFSHPETDYLMWLDADDVLNGRENFIAFRDVAMSSANVWMATYRYALDPSGKSLCSFARERVINRKIRHEWKYFVHEGLMVFKDDGSPMEADYASSWTVDHMRTEEDLKKDARRNLSLFETRKDSLDSRMQYYYGKELFENKQAKEGYEWLMKAVQSQDLAIHDRILGIQYAAQAAIQCDQYEVAVQLCHQGLQLTPNRAEFYCLIADSYLKKKELINAVPFLHAARNCTTYGNDAKIVGPVFAHEDAYGHYPSNQLSRVYLHLGDTDRALRTARETQERFKSKESEALLSEMTKSLEALTPSVSALSTSEDIWITCHPEGFYEWDEEIAKERGIGGSETAVVEMAREIHIQTGRKVMVFNNRQTMRDCNGVVYLPASEISKFSSTVLPSVHIAWRHNMRLTPARTFVWCHDLGFPGIENHQNYEKVFALSNFHKEYLRGMYGVPNDRIWVTRNGIKASRHEEAGSQLVLKGTFEKDKGKVVFVSSPDRGLKEAMLVMDQVRLEMPEATLHAYYGFDNLLKAGRRDIVKELEAMILDRPWVNYHGNIQQDALRDELRRAEVWLYPTWFKETFCISALEAVLCRVYPVVRKLGALPDTLAGLSCDLIDLPCETKEQRAVYAERVVMAIKEEKWQGISYETTNPHKLSWASVASDWIEYLGLKR